MGLITLKVSDSVEQRFRRKVAEVYGLVRGSLSKAAEDAMLRWVEGGSGPFGSRKTLRSVP